MSDDLAGKLYGTTTPGDRNAPASRKSTDNGRAPTLLGPQARDTRPERPQHSTGADRPTDEASRMYSAEKLYHWEIEPGVKTLRDEGWSDEKIDGERREMSELFTALEIPVQEAGTLHSLIVRHRLKPADADTIKGWAKESRQQLRAKYGDDADARVTAAKAYIRGDERLREMLTDTGLGSHPDVVMRFAERGQKLSKGKRS